MPKKKAAKKGRPAIDRGEFDHLNMRVAKERKSRWQKAAAREGLSLSAWIRKLADDASA